MDFVLKSKILNHYKRKDVQQEMVREAQDKEIAISYGGKGYGKRPDALFYPKDVIEMVKKGATSFHASEELWHDPLNIVTGAKKKDMDEIRKGWDLVIDIDCPFWKLAKITAWLVVKALHDFGIKSISAKFSGNKGFHLGVPFEAFPETVNDEETRNEFPADAKKIALYLLDYISKKHIEVTKGQRIIFGGKYRISIDKLKEITGMSFDALTNKFCAECGEKKSDKVEGKVEFLCPACGYSLSFLHNEKYEDYMTCPKLVGGKKCGSLMDKTIHRKKPCKCGETNYLTRFNPLSIIEVDTILITSRHLYRMAYSMHEKSGLASIPINPEDIMRFSKEQAEPEGLKISKYKFLDRINVKKGEGKKLLLAARDFQPEIAKKEDDIYQKESLAVKNNYDAQELEEAIPEELFPPCILHVFKGLEDGRKRAMFIIVNFLSSVGWNYEMIEEKLKEWNKNNSEELREVLWKGQLRYHKANRKKVMPPNCDNKMYYKDLRICLPDNFCKRIKNPVQYAKLKAKLLAMNKKKKRKKTVKKKGKKAVKTTISKEEKNSLKKESVSKEI